MGPPRWWAIRPWRWSTNSGLHTSGEHPHIGVRRQLGVGRRPSWGSAADFLVRRASYNHDMTTITTDQLIESTRRPVRHAIGGFLAGALLASAAFLGVNAFSDNDPAAPAPAAQPTTAKGPATPPPVQDCPV